MTSSDTLPNKTYNFLSLFSSYNTFSSSHFWHWPHKIINDLLYSAIKWLLKHNGYEPEVDGSPVWSPVLGKMSEEAIKNNYSINHLYLAGFRVLSFVCVARNNEIPYTDSETGEEKTRKDHMLNNLLKCDHRFAFNVIKFLGVGGPDFMAYGYQDAKHRKDALKTALVKNTKRFDYFSQELFDNIEAYWNPEKSSAFNLGMIPIRLLWKTLYGNNDVPDELFELTDKQETLWQDIDTFTPAEFRKTKKGFLTVSKNLLSEDKYKSAEEPKFAYDLQESLTHLQSHLPDAKQKDYNATGLFGVTQNVSRVMFGLVKILTNPEFMAMLHDEKQKMKDLMPPDMDPNSPKGIKFIFTHSEIFNRFMEELFRTGHVAPVVYRVNLNLIELWGLWRKKTMLSEELDINLPPRSIGIFPQAAMNRSAQLWSEPDTFNPMRSEYHYIREEGTGYIRTGEHHKRPETFGIPSVRSCPGAPFTKDTIKTSLVRFCDMEFIPHDPELVEKHALEVPASYCHHQRFQESGAAKIYGTIKPVASLDSEEQTDAMKKVLGCST